MSAARLYHTLRHLKPEQWIYRGWYPIKKRLYVSPANLTIPLNQATIFGERKFYSVARVQCYDPAEIRFSFLNISHAFDRYIDWDHMQYGKLWTYNLNYFAWLEDESISLHDRLESIRSYLEHKHETGNEAYPSSLRGIQWIKFLAGNKIAEQPILERLYKDYHRLNAFTEYHIQANHLLENGFSLFFAAHYFNDKDFYEAAEEIVSEQLEEQILPDGGHYELSPMYHCVALQRLLECIEMGRISERFPNVKLQQLMEGKASAMLGWLEAFCFKDGSYAMVGDAAPGIAPEPRELQAYAKHLEIEPLKVVLKESGYRKISTEKYQLIADCGNILPNYQPGHAHADTLNFCLNVEGKPVIVDTGISTYEKDQRRMAEKGTQAHNTINIDGLDSSEVWDGFRVGRRAKVSIARDEDRLLSAWHNGYSRMGIVHERTFRCEEQRIVIEDRLKGHKGQRAFAHIHFHPDCKPEQTGPFSFRANGIIINISGATGAELVNYLYCSGFNRTQPGVRLRIHVEEHAVVSIEL